MRWVWTSALGGALLLCCTMAQAAPVADPLVRPALTLTRAPRAFLTSVTRAGERIVAVGERGVVLLSDDAGRTWRQGKVPVSVTLTAVQFPTPRQGWAIGHGGVVIHSEDGGETWVRQLDGRALAKIALDAAQVRTAQANAGDTVAKKQLATAQQLRDDGADKPLLALHFRDDKSGIVVGAYGLVFATDDGGTTWQSWMDRVDNPNGLHFYAVGADGDTVYLAGEQALFARSTDAGKSFARLETPYRGSYFALAVLSGGALILAGLRGNIYWSADRGTTLAKADSGVPVSLTSVITLRDETLLFANQAGQVLLSRDRGRTLQPFATQGGLPASALVEGGDGTLVAVGPRGAVRLAEPGATTGAAR